MAAGLESAAERENRIRLLVAYRAAVVERLAQARRDGRLAEEVTHELTAAIQMLSIQLRHEFMPDKIPADLAPPDPPAAELPPTTPDIRRAFRVVRSAS